jgi:hypothetical protein
MTGLETIHPDLQPHVVDDPLLGLMVHHPLVIATHIDSSVVDMDGKPLDRIGMINEGYAHKQKALAEAEWEGDWTTYILLHERPYRLDALLEIIDREMGDFSLLWPLVADVWTDTESIRINQDTWRDIWLTPCRHRHRVMSKGERAALKRMPAVITVYRGVGHRKAVKGLSWTTDRERGEWFARRFTHGGRRPLLASGQVHKRDVLAYFTGRKESEIVTLPESVTGVAVDQIAKGREES